MVRNNLRQGPRARQVGLRAGLSVCDTRVMFLPVFSLVERNSHRRETKRKLLHVCFLFVYTNGFLRGCPKGTPGSGGGRAG